MTSLVWSIRGPRFMNCNCNYGCPCQFNAPPSDGTCRGVIAWQIEEGYYGDVRLDGLLAVNTYGWPGPIHQGNGEMQTIIDERASPEQRTALQALLRGEGANPEKIMLQIYAAMCPTKHETLFRRIEVTIGLARRIARLRVPGLIETEVEPIRNPVTGAEHRAAIDLPLGRDFTHAEVASGRTRATGAVPLSFERSHAHFVNNALTSDGPRP